MPPGKIGQVHENPLTGNRIRFLHVPETPSDGVLTFEVTIAPGQHRVPFELRKQPQQEQYLLVTQGALCGRPSDLADHPENYDRFQVEDSDQSSPPRLRIEEGQELHLDRGIGHQFRNCEPDSETKVIVHLTPPRDTFQWIANGYQEAYRRVGETNPLPFTESSAAAHEPPAADGEEPADTTAPPATTPTDLDSPREQEPDPRSDPVQGLPFPSILGSFRRFWRRSFLPTAVIGGLYSMISLGIYLVFVWTIGVEHAQHTPLTHLLYYSLGFILFIPVLGYFARISRTAVYRYDTGPTFRDLPSLLTDGIKVAFIGTMFFFYPGVAILAVLGPFALPARFALGDITASAPWSGLVVAIGSALLALYVFPAVYMRVVETGKLRSALRFASMGPIVLRKSYFIGHLKASLLVLSILFGSAIPLILSPFLGFVLSAVMLFYGFAALSDYFARMWGLMTTQKMAGSDTHSLAPQLPTNGTDRRSHSTSGSVPRQNGQDKQEVSSESETSQRSYWTTLGALYHLYIHDLIMPKDFETKKEIAVRESPLLNETAQTKPEGWNRALHSLQDLSRRRSPTSPESDPITEHPLAEEDPVDQDVLSQLTALHKLHETGVLSDAEFEEKTETLLEGQ